jgi:ABC-2 type transport system permease protein
MGEIKIYFGFLRMHMLSGLEYKGWWMMVLQVLLTCVLDPLGTVLMFMRFGSIGPWSVERILLVYAMAVTSFGLAECFCRGFDYFPTKMIRTGEFDRLLLRPKSLFTQAAASVFHIHRFSRPVAGIAVIIWCLWRQGVQLSPLNITILVMALAGGLATYMGVFVMTSGIAFFTVKALDWIIVFTNASYQVTRIPHEYMPAILKNTFTFFMPMLVISYYPASVICSWGETTWKGLLALPAGMLFFGTSLLVWKIGVRHYKSTGS